MLEFIKLNLQLFADGGDGGDGSSASGAGEGANSAFSGEIDIPASIPEKARKNYEDAVKETVAKKATEENRNVNETAPTTEEAKATEKMSYLDLIKSDEYKDEHKAYMDKTISDRLKKYKGIEDGFNQQKQILDTIATKYGLDSKADDFLQKLAANVEADDSYYDEYALEHNISNEEARRIVSMEKKLSRIEEEKTQKEREEQARAQVLRIRQNAEKTKALFPEFDIDSMMQNEAFRNLCFATNGDTTATYMACNWQTILPATAQKASKQIQTQTAQAVAANQARPIENGISSSAPSVVDTSFDKMSLKEIRAFADEQIRKAGRT